MESKTALAALAALSQETRLAIFRLLVEAGPTGMSVGEIGASVKASAPTLSFHLKELAHADLIRSRQDGRYVFYSANYGRMNALIDFLTENCCARDCGPGSTSCRPARGDKQAPRRPRQHRSPLSRSKQ